MKIKIPKFIIDYFSSECLKSVEEDGMIETLALGLGRIVNNHIQVEELIFPAQKGKSDSVEDKGKIVMKCMKTIRFQLGVPYPHDYFSPWGMGNMGNRKGHHVVSKPVGKMGAETCAKNIGTRNFAQIVLERNK